MKKVFTIIGLCCLVAIIAVGIYMALPSKTIDFRGTVTKIETIDNNTMLKRIFCLFAIRTGSTT